MNRKLTLALVVVLVLVSTLIISSCAPKPAPAPAPAPAPTPTAAKLKYDWKISQIYTDPRNPNYATVEMFRILVRERTGGRIMLTHFAGELLGDWTVQCEELSRGSIQIANGGTNPAQDKKINAMFLNYIYFDDQTARQAWMLPDGWITKMLGDVHQGINIKPLWAVQDGWMGIGLVKGKVPDVTSVDGWFRDTSKIKLRNEPAKIMELCAKAMGFNPTTIPYSELYSALQLGTVDGWIGGGLFHQVRWADIIKTFIQMRNKVNGGWISINLDAWKSLSNEDQKILTDAASEVQGYGWDLAERNETMWADEAKAAGMTILDPSPQLINELTKRVRALEWDYAEKELVGKEMMDRVRQYAPKVQ